MGEKENTRENGRESRIHDVSENTRETVRQRENTGGNRDKENTRKNKIERE